MRDQCQQTVMCSPWVDPYIKPSPKHPCSVLIDLQHLDVVDGKSEADGGQDEQSANPRLCGHCSTESFAGDHDSTSISDQRQQDDDVAVDAVHESPLLSDGRCELEDHE